jgi:hypothetical protein
MAAFSDGAVEKTRTSTANRTAKPTGSNNGSVLGWCGREDSNFHGQPDGEADRIK